MSWTLWQNNGKLWSESNNLWRANNYPLSEILIKNALRSKIAIDFENTNQVPCAEQKLISELDKVSHTNFHDDVEEEVKHKIEDEDGEEKSAEIWGSLQRSSNGTEATR